MMRVTIETDVFAVSKQVSEDKTYYQLTIGTDHLQLPFAGTYAPKIVPISEVTYEYLLKAKKVAVVYNVTSKTMAPWWEWSLSSVGEFCREV